MVLLPFPATLSRRCFVPLHPTHPLKSPPRFFLPPPNFYLPSPHHGRSHAPPAGPHRFSRQLSSVAVPPLVFGGLLITLWAYKCMMLVIFQNKIIYMPFMPPGARREKISDYTATCDPVKWTEHQIPSADGKRIALCIGTVQHQHHTRKETQGQVVRVESQPPADRKSRVIIFYFQGNASSLPPRLPGLSRVLKAIVAQHHPSHDPEYTILALSYRGFWKSTGKPSQGGIELDASAALLWAEENFANSDTDTRFVVWGQSIGAGVAARAAEGWLEHQTRRVRSRGPPIDRLVLETPFTSVRDMLATIYPQKWLPYRYLWPFLRNWWDTRGALRRISQLSLTSRTHVPHVFIVQAGKDELVPRGHGIELERVSREVGLPVTRLEVDGALHTEVMFRSQGVTALASCLRVPVSQKRSS